MAHARSRLRPASSKGARSASASSSRPRANERLDLIRDDPEVRGLPDAHGLFELDGPGQDTRSASRGGRGKLEEPHNRRGSGSGEDSRLPPQRRPQPFAGLQPRRVGPPEMGLHQAYREVALATSSPMRLRWAAPCSPGRAPWLHPSCPPGTPARRGGTDLGPRALTPCAAASPRSSVNVRRASSSRSVELEELGHGRSLHAGHGI
jgi:hypothetical protein